MAYSLASVSMRSFMDGSAICSIGAVVKVFFNISNTACSFSVQFHTASFLVRWCSGRVTWLYCLINLLQKLVVPKNDCKSFRQVGIGHSVMADTFFGEIAIEPFPTITPKNSTFETLNSHFSGLT